jgi:hypothetical protein
MKVTERLASGQMTEKEKMQYLLISQVLYTLFIYHALVTVIVVDTFFALEFVLVTLIAIYGVYKCYEANGGSAGKGLLEKFLCLSVPLAIKIGALVFSIFYIYQFIGGHLYNNPSLSDPQLIHKLVSFAIAIFAQLLFFWRMWVNLEKAETLSQQSMPSNAFV